MFNDGAIALEINKVVSKGVFYTSAAGNDGNSGYLAPWKFIRDPSIASTPGEHIEDRMSEEAAKYIHAHKDGPFYLNYWAYSVHSPWNARPDYIEACKRRADPKNPQHNPLYAAMEKVNAPSRPAAGAPRPAP